jgi:hypothetical protein
LVTGPCGFGRVVVVELPFCFCWFFFAPGVFAYVIA